MEMVLKAPDEKEFEKIYNFAEGVNGLKVDMSQSPTSDQHGNNQIVFFFSTFF